jgi:hypothetical protein
MRIVRTTVGTAMALSLAFAPLEAAPKGKGPAPVKVSAPKASKAPKAAPSPKTTKTTAKVTKAPKATTVAKGSSAPKTKTTTTSQTKLAKTETRSTKTSGTASAITSPTTTPTTPTPIDFTTGKVGDRLTKNTKLAAKLASQLTALGYTGSVFEAGYGFKNLGQFVAAVQNAQNQDLSFVQLKTLMTGVSVDAAGVVLYANRNPDGTVTMVPLEALTDPAPTTSLGQAKKTITTSVVPPVTTTTTAAVRVTR